jgi:hypothetical protein
MFDTPQQEEQHQAQEKNCAKSRPNRGFIGTIQLLPAPYEQEFDAVISVSLNASNAFLTEHVAWETSDESVLLKIPSPWRDDPGCLAVDVDIYLRQNLTLENFSLSANVSSVSIPKPLGLVVNKETKINLDAGSLHSNPFFQSSNTYLNVHAGSIHGSYSIYDTLTLSTQAGSITADIIPKPEFSSQPAPANLTATSRSGSITILYPPKDSRDKIPAREYYTTAHADHGSIRGFYLHGANTTLSTAAGSIDADILPYSTKPPTKETSEQTSYLTTTSHAGRQHVHVFSPYLDPGKPLRNLHSTHRTSVSGVRLEYPSEWEGSIDGKTHVGSLKLEGKGVNIIEEGNIGPVGHYLKAEKGDGDSVIEFEVNVGIAELFIM